SRAEVRSPQPAAPRARVRPHRVPQRRYLFRSAAAGAVVRDVHGRARPRRDPGARQGGDPVRTGATAAGAGGAARADLPPGPVRVSAGAARAPIVKVAVWSGARADGVLVA